MLPPFYYKGVGDDGVYASIAEVIERRRSSPSRLPVSHSADGQRRLFIRVIGRLLKASPGIVVGLRTAWRLE
jgi:4-hydroxy-tetrahydrodipicolinate synthase